MNYYNEHDKYAAAWLREIHPSRAPSHPRPNNPHNRTPVSIQIINQDCRLALKQLPGESVQCCVTSPPYWGLRNYGHPDQIGQEKTPDDFVKTMVEVFAGVKRVLKDDATLWLNLGDCYSGSGCGGNPPESIHQKQSTNRGSDVIVRSKRNAKRWGGGDSSVDGLPSKNLIGIPWRVALALQADGWYLRSDIIWAKRNCMPESVTDRPTRSHEYIFLLTKSPKYYYDAEAIKEPCIYDVDGTGTAARKARQKDDAKSLPTIERAGIRPGGFTHEEQCTGMRNKRDVWTVAPANYTGSHFATFPPDLIRPCVLAGTRPGDTVLDPFGGSGTTGQVALEYGRNAILIELQADYIPMIQARTNVTQGLGI